MTQILSAQGLEMTMAYLHLMAYCPPEYIYHFKEASSSLLEALAKQAELSVTEYTELVYPEACQRMVAFYQSTREADPALVNKLLVAARVADVSPTTADLFSEQLNQLADLPRQAKPRQRHQLFNKEGFTLNPAAMKYVLFAMVSKPDYELLQNMLAAETEKPAAERNVVEVLWTFTIGHLWRTLGLKQAYISPQHLSNLAYCLLTLSMYKSRYPFPEADMKAFLQANQAHMAQWEQGSKK